MIKLLVFDFDGTIADTKKLYVDEIYNSTTALGYKFTKNHVEKNLGPKLKKSLEDAGVREKDIPRLRDKIHRYIVLKADAIKICPMQKLGLNNSKENIK